MSSNKRSQDSFPFPSGSSHYHPPATASTTHPTESDSPHQEKKHKGGVVVVDNPQGGEQPQQQSQQYYRPPSKNPFFGVIDNVSSFNGILEGPYDFGFALTITIDRITYKGVVFRNDNKNPMFGEDATQMAQTMSNTHATPNNTTISSSSNNNNNNNNNNNAWAQQKAYNPQHNNSNDEDSEDEGDDDNDNGSPTLMSRNNFQGHGHNVNQTQFPGPPSVHFPTVIPSNSPSFTKQDAESAPLPQQPQLQRQRQRQKKRQEKKLSEPGNYTRDGSVAGNLDPTKIADESLVSMGIQALNRISGTRNNNNNNNGGSDPNSESGSV